MRGPTASPESIAFFSVPVRVDQARHQHAPATIDQPRALRCAQARQAWSRASVSHPGRTRRRRGPRHRSIDGSPASFLAITNFQLFDGKSPGLRGGQSLRIEDGRIKQVAGAGQGRRIEGSAGSKGSSRRQRRPRHP
jgi:hypothetical protein